MDERLFFGATQRNKKYIKEILENYVTDFGCILELGSGSGEHAVYFQKNFPKIIWQTSDKNICHLKSIQSWINFENLSIKMPKPIMIDIEKTPWELSDKIIQSLRMIISINVIHISPWICTRKLFEESGKILYDKQHLFLYGPFKKGGKHFSKSNVQFDKALKNENKNWGIRDIEEINLIAIKNNFKLDKIIQMPANNHSLIFQKINKHKYIYKK